MLTPINKAMKYLLFLFNFIFVLTGIFLIFIGLSINSQNDEIKEAVPNYEEYFTAPNVLIFIGCFVFIVSFFGCCGALNESHFMIFTFSVIMAAIFVAELAIGVTGYALRADAPEQLANALTDSMKNYNTSIEAKRGWDSIQGTFECCGSRNYTDWDQILGHLPLSCCTPPAGTKGVLKCENNSPTLYKKPCFNAISSVVEDNVSTIGLSAIVIAALQLLGVIFSCHLAHSIRKDYQTV